MPAEIYDVIVAGVGGMGSATLHHLATLGAKAAGIERFYIGHADGSSHGETRIIRKAYFLHPDYVPLLHRSYVLWRELEAASGKDLLHLTGLLCVGEEDSPFIRGLEHCFAEYALPHEKLDAAEAMRRYPPYDIPEDAAVYLDPEGGYLRPEECVRAHAREAEKKGARIYENEILLDWKVEGGEVIVQTSRRTMRAGKLILTTGAWVAPEFAKLKIPLRVQRKVLFWHRVRHPARFTGLPVYIWKKGGLDFYGFPCLDGQTVKNAEDSGGLWIDRPEDCAREILPGDETNLRAFLERAFPHEIQETAAAKTCFYTVSSDKNFVLDYHPEHPEVILASCCSGHGFKLSAAIGEVLAYAARDGSFPRSVDFLRMDRFT